MANKIKDTAKDTYSASQDRFPEIKSIKDDIESLKTNVVGLLRHGQENGADVAAELKQKVRSRLTNLQGKGKTQFHKIEGTVKEKPAKSLAVAFVAGLVASWMFGRK